MREKSPPILEAIATPPSPLLKTFFKPHLCNREQTHWFNDSIHIPLAAVLKCNSEDHPCSSSLPVVNWVIKVCGWVGDGCRVGNQLGMSAGGLVSSSHMAAWASSSMAAKVPKERAGSYQSFQSQGPELAHCYFHRVLQDNSVTSPALIQWEEWQTVKEASVVGAQLTRGRGGKGPRT